jgi:glucokinase
MQTPELRRTIARELSRASSGTGRSTALVGFDVGGTKCAVSVARRGAVEEVLRVPTGSYRDILDTVVDCVRSLDLGRRIRMGISCGGPLDAAAGRILNPPNLARSWHGARVVADVRRRLGAEAILMNDANACALAEWRFGAGRGARQMVFITGGTGFGAGIIVNGELLEGATGDAGEIGHVRLRDDGPLGFGKFGSVEGFCSGGGIARAAELAGHKDVTAQHVFAAAKAEEKWAAEIVGQTAARWGEALAILVDLFNPERIVLGGIYPRARAALDSIMRGVLRREALGRALRACKIVPAQLGETIGSHGAIAAAIHGAERREVSSTRSGARTSGRRGA